MSDALKDGFPLPKDIAKSDELARQATQRAKDLDKLAEGLTRLIRSVADTGEAITILRDFLGILLYGEPSAQARLEAKLNQLVGNLLGRVNGIKQ